MSLEAALQAHTAAVEKNTAALASLHAAIVQALTGKAAGNTDASTGTPPNNAGASSGVPSDTKNNTAAGGVAAGAAATGEAKRGPGRPSKEEAEKRKAAAEAEAAKTTTTGTAQTGQQTGQTSNASPAGDTVPGNQSSDEGDIDLDALLGGSPEPEKPKDYSVPDLTKMIKEISFFGQAYVKRALAEMQKFTTHNGLKVDQLPKLQVKDLNAYGALLQAIWNEGNEAARKAKDPELTI